VENVLFRAPRCPSADCSPESLFPMASKDPRKPLSLKRKKPATRNLLPRREKIVSPLMLLLMISKV